MKRHEIFWLHVVVMLLMPTFATAQEVEIFELASFETRYGDYGRYRGRAHNIRHAAEMLTEITLQPNEQLSFNGRIGERTRERGFREAPVILSGRVSEGYGGGICQVASTIYAAALYSGLKIVEHHPHTRVSSYIRPGLDATVDWDTEKDLVIENSFPFPIVMQVTTYEGNQDSEEFVVVSFLAKQKLYDVQVTFYEVVTGQFETVERVDSSLQAGERTVREPGTNSTTVTVRRTLTPRTGASEPFREQKFVVYPSSDRIVLVGRES